MSKEAVSKGKSALKRMDNSEKYEQFLSIIESNKGIVYKIAHSFCKQPEDKKDLVQEIILYLWKSFDSYNDQFKYSTWMYRIALNVAISYYRKEKSRSNINHPFTEGLFDIADYPQLPRTAQHNLFLNQFIAELKELDKALMLLYLEERPQKEIAAIIGLSETNVATKIARIKEKLKKQFSTLEK
jgi:RNA polymerase sigma-70 factor (ECF subfamily)